jgi:hypothetical protein
MRMLLFSPAALVLGTHKEHIRNTLETPMTSMRMPLISPAVSGREVGALRELAPKNLFPR